MLVSGYSSAIVGPIKKYAEKVVSHTGWNALTKAIFTGMESFLSFMEALRTPSLQVAVAFFKDSESILPIFEAVELSDVALKVTTERVHSNLIAKLISSGAGVAVVCMDACALETGDPILCAPSQLCAAAASKFERECNVLQVLDSLETVPMLVQRESR